MSSSRSFLNLFSFSLFFSLFFILACFVVDNLIGFWVFLELSGLAIVPAFFCWGYDNIYGFYGSLLTYIIMSGLSSVLMVSGILFVSLYYFIYFSFIVKFGLFPFMFWVYRVFSCSNWAFIFFLSVIIKFSILFFCYIFQSVDWNLIMFDCFITILACSCLLWWFTLSWEYLWCHISLSSVSTLLIASFCSDSILCVFIYIYYTFWAVFCIILLNYMSNSSSFSGIFWLYCFLLLVTPLSLPLFYKLSVCLALFYTSFYLLVVWSIYSFSEQFFLYKLASGYLFSGTYNSWIG
uniref:NADH dehydrogenase subunit 2 n=1 Tax=Cloacotaenia megalops TaxID=576527 RepID=A0A1L2FZE3_9CEST|nr:NADH dehydrogenase subunit 2 [Cloacotaenia megalops]AOG66050.1 NADH dehydrogenase subunit 2 [Cloacotaenia megalops]